MIFNRMKGIRKNLAKFWQRNFWCFDRLHATLQSCSSKKRKKNKSSLQSTSQSRSAILCTAVFVCGSLCRSQFGRFTGVCQSCSGHCPRLLTLSSRLNTSQASQGYKKVSTFCSEFRRVLFPVPLYFICSWHFPVFLCRVQALLFYLLSY